MCFLGPLEILILAVLLGIGLTIAAFSNARTLGRVTMRLWQRFKSGMDEASQKSRSQ
jgi:hypothetical protein